jgi:hypothetical protein
MKQTEQDLAGQRAALAQQREADRKNGYTPQDPSALRASTATAGSTTPWAESRRHLLGFKGRFR